MPVCPDQRENEVSPGRSICTSNTSPDGGAAVAHVIVNVVEVMPLVGLAVTGTLTVPVIPRLWWNVQWYGKPPANLNWKVNVFPGWMVRESQRAMPAVPSPSFTPSLVDVCWVPVVPLVQATESPSLILTELGVKTKFVADTLVVAARAELWTTSTMTIASDTAKPQ